MKNPEQHSFFNPTIESLQTETFLDKQQELVSISNPDILKEKLLTQVMELPNVDPPSIQKALSVAEAAHDQHTRIISGAPYIIHPIVATLGVIDLVGRHVVTTDTLTITLLHDTVEDNPEMISEEILKEIFNERVTYGVKALTHTFNGKKLGKKEYYEEIQRADKEQRDLYIAEIKTADRLHNILDTQTGPSILQGSNRPKKSPADILKKTVEDTQTLLIPYALPHKPELRGILREAIRRSGASIELSSQPAAFLTEKTED